MAAEETKMNDALSAARRRPRGGILDGPFAMLFTSGGRGIPRVGVALALACLVGCGPEPSASSAPAVSARAPANGQPAGASGESAAAPPRASAADAESSGAPSPTPDAGSPGVSGVACRAPSEQGCAECCAGVTVDGAGQERCTIKKWVGQGEPGPSAWYNGGYFVDGACAEDCPACDSCTVRMESKARALLEQGRPECDCAVAPGPDACFQRGSCGCYCTRRAEFMTACPTVFEAAAPS